MKNLILGALLALAACTPSTAVREPDASTDSTDAAVEAEAASAAVSPPADDEINADINLDVRRPQPTPAKLVAYVNKAMQSWRPSRDDVFYTSVAYDIATVAFENPPAFAKDLDKSQSAILLAAVAFWESGYARWVDDGLCNRPDELRERKLGWSGACDGGIAVSLWQVHPENGIVLTQDGGWHLRTSSDVDYIARESMLASRRTSARVALAIMRQSLRNGGGLCQYSGEVGPCPKADVRLNCARNWIASHPYAGR